MAVVRHLINYTLVGRWPRRINWWSGVSGGGSRSSNVSVIIAIWLKLAIRYCVLARMLVRANLRKGRSGTHKTAVAAEFD